MFHRIIAAGLALGLSAVAAQAATYSFTLQDVRFSGDGGDYDVTGSGTVTTNDDFVIDTGAFFFDLPLEGTATGRDRQYGDEAFPFVTYAGEAEAQTTFGFGSDLFLGTEVDPDTGVRADVFAIISVDFGRDVPGTLADLFLGQGAVVDILAGEETISAFEPLTGDRVGLDVLGTYASGAVAFTRLDGPAEIPLPAGGALMLAAFGALAALRRRA